MKNSLMSDEVAFNLAHAQKNLINLDDSEDESEEEESPEDFSQLNYLKNNFGQINENIASTATRLDYRVFNGGTTLFLTLAEKFYRQATELQEQETYNKTLLDSIHFYNNLLSAQLKLATGAKALESMKANLDLSSKFFNAGTGTKLDQMIAATELARFQKNLIDSEAAFRTSEIDLAQHLKLNLDSALQIRNEKIRVFNLVQDNLSIEEFLGAALKKNPQILKSLAIKEAAIKEGLSKVGNLLPKLDIYADRSGNGGDLNNLFHTTTLAFNVNIKVGENLGLGNFSDLAKAKLDIKKAKEQCCTLNHKKVCFLKISNPQ